MQTIRLGYGIALFSCYLHNILQVTTLDHIRSTLQLLRLILSGQCWLGILIHSPCLAVLVGVLCVLVGGQTVPCWVLWGSATLAEFWGSLGRGGELVSAVNCALTCVSAAPAAAARGHHSESASAFTCTSGARTSVPAEA